MYDIADKLVLFMKPDIHHFPLVEWDHMALQQILSPFACFFRLKFQPKKTPNTFGVNQLKKSINNITSNFQSINHCNLIEINHVFILIKFFHVHFD
jgi:hypothetical protein